MRRGEGRNSWVGFHPGITALPIQGLFGAICHGTQNLVREGTPEGFETSISAAKALVWETPAEQGAARR